MPAAESEIRILSPTGVCGSGFIESLLRIKGARLKFREAKPRGRPGVDMAHNTLS